MNRNTLITFRQESQKYSLTLYTYGQNPELVLYLYVEDLTT